MDREPENWWQLVTMHDFEFDARYRSALVERGIYYFPTPTKQGSVSFAHSDADIDETLNVIDDTLTVFRGSR
jgi:glutamate-1-semialdehyde 2,1-aminomutase